MSVELEEKLENKKDETKPKTWADYGKKFVRSEHKTHKGAKHVKNLGVTKETFKVVIVPDVELSLDEELLLLGAVEKLAYQHSNLRLHYATYRLDMFTMLRSNWFCKPSWYETVEPIFDRVFKGFIRLDIKRPSFDDAVIHEEDLYRAAHEKTVSDINRQQEEIYAQGMKDTKIPVPRYLFGSKWNKGNGFLWKLGEELGIPVDLGGNVIAPYGRISVKHKKEVWKKLKKEGYGSEPFAIISPSQPESITHREELQITSLTSNHQINSYDVKNIVGDSFPALLAVMRHPNLTWYIGGNLLDSYIAWVGGVPNVVQVYYGDRANWEALRGSRHMVIQRNQISDNELGQNILGAIEYLKENHQ